MKVGTLDQNLFSTDGVDPRHCYMALVFVNDKTNRALKFRIAPITVHKFY